MSFSQASPVAANGIRPVPSQHLSSQQLQQHPHQSYSYMQNRQSQPMTMHARSNQSRPQNPSYPRHAGAFSQNLSRPRPSGREEVNGRRRLRKVVGDGFESSYLHIGPSNRLILSLKSGLPSQIDWALSRLAQHSVSHRDLTLDSLAGLADILLAYVRRVCDAIAGKPAALWHSSCYDQALDASDVGIGAPGESGFQGASTWYTKTVLPQHSSHYEFQPSQDPTHADLLRRGVESALILRNLAMQGSNARHLASIKGFYALIRDLLALPSFCLDRSTNEQDAADANLHLDEVFELRLYFLEILEGLSHRLVLSRRSQWPIASSVLMNLHARHLSFLDRAQLPDIVSSTAQEPDDIFPRLLQMVHLTNDRALLLGSLRCLSAMASNDKNETAFVELEQPDGTCSPGLLARCLELLPITNDLELLEAVLDLLYQLVCIGNNGLRLTAAPPQSRSGLATPDNADQQSPDSAAGAFAKAAALVRLLTRNLQIGRTIWERDQPLTLHRDWTQTVPSKRREAVRKERELRIKLANETPEERAQKKRLSSKERQNLVGLAEPERGIAWMKTVFKGNPAKEVTQMEFWTTYKEEFGTEQGIALQPAADLIRTVSQIFPGAAAMVIQGVNGAPNRFIIRGIEVNERDQTNTYRCCWQSCPAPTTTTAEAQQSHAKTHASFGLDGKCRWLTCEFKAPGSLTAEATAAILLSHVLTHLSSVEVASSPLPDARTIVDDDSQHEAAQAEHTGIAPDFEKAKHSNGTRYISGKRNGDGERVKFDMSLRELVKNNSHRPIGSGTVDNPGLLTFEVVRTPSAGADDYPSPQGPAYVSILILRMLTRNAARLLRKAGPTQPNSKQDDANAAIMRGEGEDKFGLPLPASFNGEAKQPEQDDKADGDVQGPQSGGNASLATTEAWAVESAARFMDAVGGVEDELVLHSYQNDILARYINETLVELRSHTSPARTDEPDASIDPNIAMSDE